jgi:hypothetical protein
MLAFSILGVRARAKEMIRGQPGTMERGINNALGKLIANRGKKKELHWLLTMENLQMLC